MSEVNLEEFRKAGGDLLQLADRKLVLSMRRDLREIAKPVGGRIVEAIAEVMPKRGGLAQRIRSQGRVSLLVDLRRGVRIQLSNKAGIYMGAFEAGSIRHPVYGHRKRWVLQNVPGGAGAEAFAMESDALADAVSKKVTETARSALA